MGSLSPSAWLAGSALVLSSVCCGTLGVDIRMCLVVEPVAECVGLSTCLVASPVLRVAVSWSFCCGRGGGVERVVLPGASVARLAALWVAGHSYGCRRSGSMAPLWPAMGGGGAVLLAALGW